MLTAAQRRWLLLATALCACLLLVSHASRAIISIGSWNDDSFGLIEHRDGTSSFAGVPLFNPSETAAISLVRQIAKFSLVSNSSRALVSVCAVASHEAQYLPEWITYHRLLGIDRFYLFDNAPSDEMRNLLRPWIEEGSVVLYQLNYKPGENIAEIYQDTLLDICHRDVLPVSAWTAHFDVDEFLLVDAPGWSKNLPEMRSTGAWDFPLHRLLDRLHDATCVPMTRVMFANVGVREIAPNELITERHTTREISLPNRKTYGKMFIHAGEKIFKATFFGPHSCRAVDWQKSNENVILDCQGIQLFPENSEYPSEGLPLPQQGLLLNHYGQRSLLDCYRKIGIVASAPNDWRTIDGLAGCARNFIPTEFDFESIQNWETNLTQQGLLEERPDAWIDKLVQDTKLKESWAARMTRAMLKQWRGNDGKFQWENPQKIRQDEKFWQKIIHENV